MADSDCVMVMGSNMAENHPVAFRWPMQAKTNGAKLIHVDPRFTRTSAMADIYAPIRAGSDIAFLGGIITYVINSERWQGDPFFRDYVAHYTNAATIVSDDFKDTEDNDGVFSGLLEYKEPLAEWPYNGFLGKYDPKSWQYAQTKQGAQGEAAAHQRTADHRVRGAPPASPRQLRSAGRWHHGPPRARVDPGLHRHSDALPLDSRLHAGAHGAQEARHAAGLHEGRNTSDRVLVE